MAALKSQVKSPLLRCTVYAEMEGKGENDGGPSGSPCPAQVNNTLSSGAQNTASPVDMEQSRTLNSDPEQANSAV